MSFYKQMLCTMLTVCAMHSAASPIFSITSDCDLDETKDEISIELGLTQRHGQAVEEITYAIRDAIFEQLQPQLDSYPSGIQVRSMAFKRELLQNSLINEARVIGRFSAKAVTKCNDQFIISKGEELDARFAPKKKLTAAIEMSSKISMPSKKRLNVASKMISSESIFGVDFGTHFEDAERMVGRFSLVWQLEDGIRLASVGRNYMLFFIDGKLAGYQYAKNLLPTAINNLVELSPTGVDLHFASHRITDISHAEFTKAQMSELAEHFNEVSSSVVKTSDEGSAIRLEGLQIGKLPELSRRWSYTHCLNNEQVMPFIENHQGALIRLISESGHITYLTGCGQAITLSANAEVKEMTLLEPIRVRNALMWQVNTLFALQPWQFGGLKYQVPVSDLKFSSSEIADDVLTVEHSKWYGHFFVENDKVVGGTLQFNR
ncbi:hypothetical protein [Pseudoalteromonas rubra]|uniref:Uncharacterized protein n=1 Tax=Pseudoalteromonas rubra TaxID=43658 RepID=A0A5S3WUP7_9GAMM|nr:hypothetical protein [Pseudoalteromonas rubra]TMP32558.1 hypothetical protein CWB98_21410 [Pseudoalteromonas rubra]